MNENTRIFNTLDEIAADDVAWLKDGSTNNGRYINNNRAIIYTTKRGVTKSITCFVYSNGDIKWRSFTTRNSSDGLTNEEARVFAPQVFARRKARNDEMERRAADKLASAMKTARPVSVGDVFAGSFGYDATLWCFYEVVSVSKSGKSVTVRELRHETASGYGYNDWKCRPALGCYKGAQEKHVVKWSTYSNEATPYFTVMSYMSAYRLADPTAWHDADNYH